MLGVLNLKMKNYFFIYNGGQMSLGQLLDSFQICVFYSPRHYYDPLPTAPPPPLPPGNVEKILANIDIYFACVTSVQPTQFNIVWGGRGKLLRSLLLLRLLSQHF